MKKINVGIAGGAGYTGGELLRILIHHPEVHISFVHSSSNAGKPVSAVHTDLVGDTDLVFMCRSWRSKKNTSRSSDCLDCFHH
jgi:N-acetyl-gamma-glutamyl-phosphate reductase